MAARAIICQAQDTNGDIISGALLHVEEAGTNTDRAIFTDAALSTASTNPAVADSTGSIRVFINDANGNYKVRLTSSDGATTYFTEDGIDPTKGNFLVYPLTGDQGLSTTSTPTFAGLTLSGNLDLDGSRLVLDADADTYIEASTDDRFDVVVGGVLRLRIDPSAADVFSFDGVTFSPTGAVVGQALGYPNSANTLEPYTPAGGGDLLAAANETVTGDYNFTGALQKSGANVYAIGDTGIGTIADLAAILKANLNDGALVQVKQYGSVANRGGGVFAWDASSTATADNVVIFESDEGGTGRWVRQHKGSVDLYDAGCVPGGTDCTTQFQAAINAMENVGTLEIPWSLAGFTVGAVTVDGEIRIQGKGEKAKIVIATTTANWCTIASTDIWVDNLEFTSGANCTNALFLIDTSAGAYEEIHFTNIRTNGLAAAFVRDDATDQRRLDEIYHDNITLVAHAGPGFVYRDAFAFIFFRRCFVDYVGSASPNHIAFDLDGDIDADSDTINVEGAVFNKCEVTGTNGTTAQKGFSIKNASAVFFLRCFADTTGGEGYLFENVSNLHINDCIQSLCDGSFTLNDVTIPQVTKVRIIGRKGLADTTASIDGMLVSNGTIGGTFTNIRVENATGNGIHCDHSTAANTRNMFSGLSLVVCTEYGLRSTGTTGSPSGTFSDVYFDGNTSGDYLLANQGAGSGFERVVDYIRNSGVYDICGGNGTVGGDLTVSGDLSGSTASLSGDFDVDTDTLFVDVSADRVGINQSTTFCSLHVLGSENASTPSAATPVAHFFLEANAAGVGQGFGLMAGVNIGTGAPWLQASRTTDTGGTDEFPIWINPLGGNLYVNKNTGAYGVDVDGDVNVDTGHVYRVNGVSVIAGEGAAIANPNAITAYTAPTISASPTQSEVQAIANALQTLRNEVEDLRAKEQLLIDRARAKTPGIAT